MPRRFRLPRPWKGRSKQSGQEEPEQPTTPQQPSPPEQPTWPYGQAPPPPSSTPPSPAPTPEEPTPPTGPPKPPRDLWFRFATRLRAVGYWTREKAQIAWRALRRGAAAAAEFWRNRSPETRTRTYVVASILGLYLIIKFAPVPGVPCQVSAAKECAPPDDTIAYVPENALLYAHLTIDRDSHQFELADDLSEDLPDATLLAGQVAGAIPTPSGQPIDIGADLLPWAKQDMALILLPGPAATSLPVFITGVEDKAGAEEFLAGIVPGKPKQADQGGTALNVYPGGFATAFADDQLLLGIESAVRVALDAEAGRVPGLDGSDQDQAREELPDVRFAEIYLSRPGVQRLLAGGAGAGATQLETFVDYGATSGMAASLRIKDDGVEASLVSELDEKLLAKSPTFFANLPEFEPDLAGEAGARALAYVGVGEVGPTLAEVLAGAGVEAQGLAGSLRALAQTLQQRAGVDPLKDLLPALGGQAALVAEPTDAVPFASLIVDDVDQEKAKDALARLQGPLVKAIGTQTGVVAAFKKTEEDGVEVNSVQVSPAVNLSYAVFDGLLVVSTDPAGVARVRASGDDLAGTDAYERVVDALPDEVSALVFLNLDELLGLAEQAGLAEDPVYASLSDDISNIPSLGLTVNGSEQQILTELFLSLE